jgi:hypothetical protein
VATKHWTLTDVANRQYVPEIEINAQDVGGSVAPFTIRKFTLRGGRSDGVDVVRVDNGRLRFDVLPTRGMSLWKLWLGEMEIGWRSPVRGPVHPALVPVAEPSGLGWLDGFDEMLVRCGLESNGAPEFDEQDRVRYPLHGRIGNLPAHEVRVSVDESGQISVTGIVEEVRFHFLKLRLTTTITTKIGQAGLAIHDTVENLSASPAEAQLLYHVNFGAPLLDAGSQVLAPIKTLVPRNEHAAEGIGNWSSYAAEQPGFEEQVYFLDLAAAQDGGTRVLLKNGHGTHGVSLRFNRNDLPCFTVWKNTTALEDGYVTGLEPGTNYPNPRTFEGQQGRVVKLAGNASRDFHLGIDLHGDAASVTAAQQAVAQLQAGTTPKVFDSPQPGWCADA